MSTNWLEDVLNKGLLELEEEKKNPNWFGINVISNVPYISFPGFSEKECKEVQEQARNVLKISRNENNYKEVAITYKRDNSTEKKDYYKILGDYTSVPIMADERTSKLINFSNNNHELVVISIHNHPNNSRFSINDLLVFTENPSIKLMEIVNKNGEVSFLFRPYELNLHNIVTRSITDNVPDFNDRKNLWKENNPDKYFKLSDLLNFKERTIIVSDVICELLERGVCYCRYVNQEQAKNLTFDLKDSSQSYNEKIVKNINNFSLSSEEDDYYENGEDGYEWM